MNKELSPTLLAQIKESIRNADPPQYVWDIHDQLPPNQVNLILALPDGYPQVEYQILDHFSLLAADVERRHIAAIVKQYLPQIAAELGYSDQLLDNWESLIDQYRLMADSPGIYMNMPCLLDNTHPRVVLQLDLHFPYKGSQWTQFAQYDQVKPSLDLFNINPRKMHSGFPDLPERDGYEYITPKNLKRLWYNCPYRGQYVLPFHLRRLSGYVEQRNHFHRGLLLHKGCQIRLHNYEMGTGTFAVPLERDLILYKINWPYHFGDDNQTIGFSLSEVHDLTAGSWHNQVSPIISPYATAQQLPPAQSVIAGFYYGNRTTAGQISRVLRPHNDQRTTRRNTVTSAGVHLAWDMDHLLWEDFPARGKRYLRHLAAPDAYH